MSDSNEEAFRWIPVSERLPDPDQWYSGLYVKYERDFKDDTVKARIYLFRTGYPSREFPLPDDMTHWCPLPTPQMLGGQASMKDLSESDVRVYATAGSVAPARCAASFGYPLVLGG